MQSLALEFPVTGYKEVMGYKEDLQVLQGKIDELKVPRASFWQKASPVIALVALAFTIFVFWTNHSSTDMKNEVKIEVGDQLKEPLKTLADTAADVRGIKEYLALGGFRAFVELTPFQARKALPQLHKSLELASGSSVKLPLDVVEQAGLHLLKTSTEAPDYWPTAALLISYRSELLSGAPEPTASFPPCRGPIDVPVAGGPNTMASPMDKNGKPMGPSFLIRINRLSESKCTAILDGKTGVGWDCAHCIVLYSGAPVSLKDVKFIDCLFVFRLPNNAVPPSSGRRLSEQLLASKDLREVSVVSIS
jgi:hypothetical protein